MLIELKHSQKLNGEEFYYIYVDGSCEICKCNLDEAVKMFKTVVKNAKRGLPRTKTIESVEI